MQHIAFRSTYKACTIRLPNRRALSSLSATHLDKKISGYTNHALKITKDPVWNLLLHLKRENSDSKTHDAILKCDISLIDFVEWKRVIFAPDINQAMIIVGNSPQLQAQTRPSGNFDRVDGNGEQGEVQLPSWVALTLAAHKVRSPAHAQHILLHLVFSQIRSMPSHYSPSLLVIATHSLAHFGILQPMRRIVHEFLTRPVKYPSFQFNALLRALSSFRRTEEAAELAVLILEAMNARAIPLWLETYRSLLTDRFVTLQLTKYLRAKMIHEGVVPEAKHLEDYLRIFSNHGAIHESGEYLRAIREHCLEHGLTPPHAESRVANRENAPSPSLAHTANTLYLGSLRKDRASAFHYLHHLLALEQNKPATSHKSIELPASQPRSSTTTFWSDKKHVDIYDWTTALVSAANDKNISATALIDIFNRARAKTHRFRPTIVTYTVLLRGLLFRQSFEEALKIWNQLLDSGLTLDRKALTIGVQILTRAGRGQEAFYLLNSFARVQRESVYDSSSLDGEKSPPLWINIIVVNEFLVSLLRVRRPDVVFKIWDNLEMLYGILPNENTLHILLKSAILAAKMDNESVRSTLQHLTLNTPFRAPQAEPEGRKEVESTIMKMLELKKPPSAVGIWRNSTAKAVGRQIFVDMIYGNWPRLRAVWAPGAIVRPTGAEATPLYPLSELARSMTIPFSSQKIPANEERMEKVAELADDLLDEERLSDNAYLTIVPTDATFSAYIQILGLSSLAAEIPLTLAWMRRLKVKPTRKTLSIALVFWAEVSLRGPLFEEWAERRHKSEYGRLVEWIEDWVGKEETPVDWDIQRALRAVAKMRDSSFGQR
ncbi:hypothetical protein BJ138DRAFT_1179684 [Hygrophoropsis aurantiaca]|uniref:Uncharacterized protein n=1 Tax=Hygrophoropsis aurantiaca TaxID=72124 RepID=A0ACB8AD10_9AGAM|nr:hypothetical protein BJ138DRAFT_1179684 [Hygrophoropsis aurantiaca]